MSKQKINWIIFKNKYKMKCSDKQKIMLTYNSININIYYTIKDIWIENTIGLSLEWIFDDLR